MVKRIIFDDVLVALDDSDAEEMKKKLPRIQHLVLVAAFWIFHKR